MLKGIYPISVKQLIKSIWMHIAYLLENEDEYIEFRHHAAKDTDFIIIRKDTYLKKIS